MYAQVFTINLVKNTCTPVSDTVLNTQYSVVALVYSVGAGNIPSVQGYSDTNCATATAPLTLSLAVDSCVAATGATTTGAGSTDYFKVTRTATSRRLRGPTATATGRTRMWGFL